MPTFADLMGISSGGGSGGGPFVVLGTIDTALTIPEGIRYAFVSCRSANTAYALTLPLIAGCLGGAAIVLSCPDGAANNVTVTAAAGNTVLTAATLVVSGDNLIALFATAGTTDWQGHVGT